MKTRTNAFSYCIIILFSISLSSCDFINNLEFFKKSVTVEILPNPIEVVTNTSVTLTAATSGELPTNINYVWNYNDGTKIDTILNINTTQHQFSVVGEYLVTVELYNSDTDELLDEATAVAIVSDGSFVGFLQEFKKVRFYLDADIRGDHELAYWSGFYFENQGYEESNPVTWEQNRFRFDIDTIVEGYPNNSFLKLSIEGEMNELGDTIKSIIGFQEFYYPETDKTYTYELEIVDLPISPYYILFENAPYYYAEGVLVEQHVLSFSIKDYRWDENDNSIRVNSTSIDYESSKYTPGLMVRFFN